jgi:hypothetical protein
MLCVTIGLVGGFIDGAQELLAALPVGVLLSMGGTLAWTRHFCRHKKFKIAGRIFFTGLAAMAIAPKNVHGPGMLLVLTAVCAWILSIILTITAAVTDDRPATPV